MNYYVKIITRNDLPGKEISVRLYLRLTFNRKVRNISLFKSVETRFWDEKSGTVCKEHPQADQINLVLKSHIKRANDIIFNYEVANKELTFDDFMSEFKRPKSQSYYDFVEQVLENNINTNEFAPESLKTQKTEITKLKQFRPTLNFNEISTSFLQGYEAYMRNKLGNGINTIHKSLKTMRAHINRAILSGILKENIFDRYKLKTEAGKRMYLNEDEVNELEALMKTQIHKYYKNTIRIFLFGCYTGLRYRDLKTLTYNNIENGMIRITMHKTKEQVSIPLSNRAKALIKTNDDANDKIFKVPTNQVINKFIKEVIAMTGIKKDISMHCSRHTFATLGLTLGIPLEVVSKLLGHKNIKTTQIYAKVVDTLKVKEMEKWNAI